MSDFARGVVGVFVVGLVAGAGALMFIPKSSPSATQIVSLPAPACAPNSPRKSDPACSKSAPQHRESSQTDSVADRVLSSANSVATNGRTAAGLVTVDAQAIAALRRGESLQPEPVTEPAPDTSAAVPEHAAMTAAAAPLPAPAPAKCRLSRLRIDAKSRLRHGLPVLPHVPVSARGNDTTLNTFREKPV